MPKFWTAPMTALCGSASPGTWERTEASCSRTRHAVAFSNSTLLFTDLDGAPVGPAAPPGQPLVDLEPLSAADGMIAVELGGEVGTSVGIWSTATGVLLSQADSNQAPVTSAARSTDGTRLATGSGDAPFQIRRVG